MNKSFLERIKYKSSESFVGPDCQGKKRRRAFIFNSYLLLFIFFNIILSNYSLALNILPKNSYLQAGDNKREVKYLQEILNSDPDTKIADTGVGSPGKENWYFGELTQNAVARFQQKYNLQVTEKVDLNTYKKINEYVVKINSGENFPSPEVTKSSVEITNKDDQTGEDNIFLGKTSSDYTTENSDPVDESVTKKEIKKSEKSKTFLEDSLIGNLFDRYTNYFNNKSQQPTTPVDTYSNTYSTTTPYFNPQTGIYSSNPNYANNNQQNTLQNPFLNPSANGLGQFGNPAGNNTLNHLLGGGTSGQTPFTDAFNRGLQLDPQGPGVPTVMGPSNYNLTPGGELNANKFKILSDGWVRGEKTTHFGTEWNGAMDKSYIGKPDSWRLAAMSGLSRNGPIDTTKSSTCIVSLPLEVQVYFWGDEQQKKLWPSLRGRPVASQLKSLGGINFYKKVAGTPIEVVNLNNNKCTVAPIWETGPGENEGGAIDLTPCVKKVIGDSGLFPSKFRPVKAGMRGCEDPGLNYIPSTVIKT